MIDTVLIPVDGSPAAQKAVQFGGDLASHYGARVVLLHVLLRQNLAEALRGLDETERAGGKGIGELATILVGHAADELVKNREAGTPPPREILEFIAARVIEAAEKAVQRDRISSVRSVVEDGDPATRILELAEKENADLIVMGARGLSDMEALLLGSVSQKVSHLARCTCITVR